jgi:GMP synthase-like glutamine amidotransferase
MNRYIGVKLINAKAMSREEYNELRGWTVPADENPEDAGYLVEYVDGGKANTEQFAGYVSWSPKDVFERAYRPCNGMTFGHAIEAMKQGAKVARAGWNGKGMWLALGAGNPANPASNFWNQHTRAFAEQNGGSAPVLPYIIMKTAAGEILMGWLASQTDMLAEDWIVVE